MTTYTEQNLIDGLKAMNIRSGTARYKAAEKAYLEALTKHGSSHRDAIEVGLETAVEHKPSMDQSKLEIGLTAAGIKRHSAASVKKAAAKSSTEFVTKVKTNSASLSGKVRSGLKGSVADTFFVLLILGLSLGIALWFYAAGVGSVVQDATLEAGSAFASFKAAVLLFAAILLGIGIGSLFVLIMRRLTGYPYETKLKQLEENRDRAMAQKAAREPIPTPTH